MNYFRVGWIFVYYILSLFYPTQSYGSGLHDSVNFPVFGELPVLRENQIKNVYQLSSFFIEAQDAKEFDQVKITRFSNDDYSATYRFRNNVRYRIHYQPMHQKVILINHNSAHDFHNTLDNTLDEIVQDKRNIEIQLDYTHYDPLNVHFNVARMVSSGFVQHLEQAINCTGQSAGACSTGYTSKTETHNHYQPYTLNPVSRITTVEESHKSTRIDMDGEEVFISYNGSGTYRRTRVSGRQHGNQEQTQPKQTDPQPSTSNTASTAGADRTISGSAAGSASSSGDENGDDDPDKRKQHDKKEPDDYQEMPSDTPELTQTQVMQYLRFINEALNYQIDKEVTVDHIIVDLLRLWANQPKELALALRNYLREQFGVSPAELAVLENAMTSVIDTPFSTFAYKHRNCEESYYCTALLNAYLAELKRHYPGLSEPQLITLSDLLTQTFGQIIAFNRINELLPLINQHGLCLPHRLKETKSSAGCQGASCGMVSYCSGERIANVIRTVFGTQSAVMAFSTLITSFLYFNFDEYFNPDVEVDELLVLLMSGFSTGASIVASVLNTVSLWALLKMAPCFSNRNIMVLGGLNTLKDLFTITGLIFGMMLPDQPENLRLCQVLNGIFGAAFPVYLLHSIKRLYNSQCSDGQNNDAQIVNQENPGQGNPAPLLQPRDRFILLASTALTASVYGASRLLGALSDCQPDVSTFFTTGITSAWCNLGFPRDSTYAETVRLGSYIATAFVFASLWKQHKIIREISSQTDPAISDQLQHVTAMRRPLNIRAVISVLTLLGSFFDRFGINPLSFWWIPLLDTAKSIYFEGAVQALRERVIAANIHGLKTDELKQSFNEAVRAVEIHPDMTMGEYIERIYDQFDKACIRTKRSSSDWVRSYATHDQFEALLNLNSLNDDGNEKTHVIRPAGQQGTYVQIHPDIFTPPAIPDTGETANTCDCNGACNCATYQQSESGGRGGMRESTENIPLPVSRFTIEPVVIDSATRANTENSEDDPLLPPGQTGPEQTNKED